MSTVPYAIAPSPVGIPRAPQIADSQDNAGFVSTYKSPWIDPPPQFDPVDKIAYVTIPAISATVFATVLSYRVSTGRNGVIKSYGNNYVGLGFQEGSGNLYWQIRRNGNPIKFYEQILASLGTPQSPTPHPSGFRVFENDLIEIVVFNISIPPAGQLIGARICGWQYPKKFEDPRAWV